MNKFLLFVSVLFTTSLFAKKVKFAVDMTGQTISAFGVHVAGDFQISAGYSMDWDYAGTMLSQEGATDIYSIVVDIPAFKKYEFKFVNGDQGYESEYVPDEVRVGYDFNDNRWLYVDSLKNDTTFIGAIQFGMSSPAGKYALRYKVDMTSVGASSNGIHLAANYNSFSVVNTAMYSFTTNTMPNVYEVINYVDAGTYNFNFVNGNTVPDKESMVPSTCSALGVRSVIVSKDTVFPEICFNACVTCALTGIKDNTKQISEFKLYPNPAKNNFAVISNNAEISSIEIYSVTGQLLLSEKLVLSKKHIVKDINLPAGLYVVKIVDSYSNVQNTKLIIE